MIQNKLDKVLDRNTGHELIRDISETIVKGSETNTEVCFSTKWVLNTKLIDQNLKI